MKKGVDSMRKPKPQPKIVHILANGKRVDSIEGHVVPEGNPAYRIILEAALERKREQEKKLA